MGTGFTIDTPIKVAKYGISSVISLVDDTLIEQVREYYCKKNNEPYAAILRSDDDHRAKRITAYLDLVDRIVKRDFERVRSSAFEPGSEIAKYFELLPNTSAVRHEYERMLKEADPEKKQAMQDSLRGQMKPGRIDVNIMTKLDRTNYDSQGNELPAEFCDALAALRGFAKSKLDSAIVLSAGFNRRLYTYFEKFEDFYANASGFIRKKIILKVSDYRSSIIQGKFFAKKGIWISEFRVESALNCGGHAFVANGELMGHILEEFRTRKDELIKVLHELCNKALTACNRKTFEKPLPLKITAQGGIGTAAENDMLLTYYGVSQTGWGTPFLLVPEATTVDPETLKRLAEAEENDLYLSGSSPLGIPFNNMSTSLSESAKRERIKDGCPGSACIKGHLVSNTEFSERPICLASRQYQTAKLKELSAQRDETVTEEQITAKACICHELGVGVLNTYGLDNPGPGSAPAICPGPNLAYFSKVMTLREMTDHIYGRANMLNQTLRQHMFIKELQMYVDNFISEVKRNAPHLTDQKKAELQNFRQNLVEGIEYYRRLFPQIMKETQTARQQALDELDRFAAKLDSFIAGYVPIFNNSITA
jgi:hypothetical protein